MKRYLRLLALMAFAITTLVACSNDDSDDAGNNETNPPTTLDALVRNVSYTIQDDEMVTAEEIADDVFGPAGANADNDAIELLRAAFLAKQQRLAEKVAAEVGANGLATGYRSINYTYTSVDEQGQPIQLSARVYWGKFFGQELDPDYIVLCPHLTIGSNAECPTMKHTYEAAAITADNLLIMPDYKGFGVTKDKAQPYINHELGAINSLDALKAGYKIFQDSAKSQLENDWKLYVVGASQGGGNALAIHKWLDTHLDEAQLWRFQYSYCCAGPYSPGLTFRKYFEQRAITYPCVFPFVIKAMFEAYPDILGKWREDDFYSTDYTEHHKAEMDRMVSSKDYSCDKINAKFFEWYPHYAEADVRGGKEILLTDILSPDALNLDSELCQALFQCFERNDLTRGWTPVHPIKLYHGRGDDVVPYANSEAIVAAFPDKATLTTSTFFDDGHIATCVKWMAQILLHNW